MAGGVMVPVHVEVLAVEVGHWCNRCLTSAGMRVWYVNLTLNSLCLHSATGCADDDHNDVELVEHPNIVWKG